jgi:hypothetical protein
MVHTAVAIRRSGTRADPNKFDLLDQFNCFAKARRHLIAKAIGKSGKFANLVLAGLAHDA